MCAAELALIGPATHPLVGGAFGILGAARADELRTGGAPETRVGNERCITLGAVHFAYPLEVGF